MSEPARVGGSLDAILAEVPADLREGVRAFVRPKRVNWCSRCASEPETRRRLSKRQPAEPREAQPGGSLCAPCAAIEVGELLTRKRDEAASHPNPQTREEKLRALSQAEARVRLRAAEQGRGHLERQAADDTWKSAYSMPDDGDFDCGGGP